MFCSHLQIVNILKFANIYFLRLEAKLFTITLHRLFRFIDLLLSFKKVFPSKQFYQPSLENAEKGDVWKEFASHRTKMT